jgi:hypothetical protein
VPREAAINSKEAVMPRLIPSLCIVLSSATWAFGDHIVCSSEQMNLWLDQGSGPLLRFSLGYQTELGGLDDPLTVIGDELWFSDPGVYDIADDTQFPEFLGWATNGQKDQR